jgi:hypothetical protein
MKNELNKPIAHQRVSPYHGVMEERQRVLYHAKLPEYPDDPNQLIG